jgi:flagellar motility protein MotE (MotC chaperone)
MMTRILSPLTLSMIGLLWGVAAGLGWFWVRADSLVALALAKAHPAEKVSEKSKGWDFWTVEVDNLASELKDEKARVKKEEEQLDLRSARLTSDRQELENLRTELNTMHKQISDKIVEIQAVEAKNLRVLAQTYTNISPHGVVAIIREMDDTTAVKILSLMKPEVVGPIFEEMAKSDSPVIDAYRAARISEKLRLVKEQKAGQTP